MKPLSQRLIDRELIQRGDLTLAFRARDTVLDRPVFVKCLNPALARDEEIRARFEREAKAVARLDHPNLVRIYEYGEDPEEGLYMLLEWLDGTTLAARIAAKEKFAGEDFSDLASQLLKGLAALHSVGILHRDLKPENILVRDYPPQVTPHTGVGPYKITDFSLAALRDAPKLTHHEAIVGTPAYMSPEQASGGEPSEASDLFSLGVVLYETATGENPFTGKSVMETLRNVRELEPSFKHPAIVSLPERARELLSKLLQKDPAQRPASANDARRILGERPALEAQTATRSPVSFSRYLVLALILVVIWLARRQFPESTRILDYVLLPVVVVGLFIARRPGRHIKPEYLRPRNRKRDLKYLAAAVAVIAFWAGMMLWYPWGGKDEGGRMKDERVKPPVTAPAVPETTASQPQQENPKSEIQNPKEVPQQSEPELRAAPEKKDENGKPKDEGTKLSPSEPQISAVTTSTLPDSVNLVLTTEPWAQVFLNGVQLGTTPLNGSVRVPGGSQTLVLRNPAFPPVQVTFNLTEPTTHKEIRLADHAALVRVNVEPWGELYLDGEHIGTTPLPRPLFVSPGHHSVRVSHPQLSAVQQEFQTAAGETLAVNVDLARGLSSVKK